MVLGTVKQIKTTWPQNTFHPNQQRILLALCNIKHFCIDLHLAYHLSIFIYVHINRTALSSGHIFLPDCFDCFAHSVYYIAYASYFGPVKVYKLARVAGGFTAVSRVILSESTLTSLEKKPQGEFH